jgi:hypothetical protein
LKLNSASVHPVTNPLPNPVFSPFPRFPISVSLQHIHHHSKIFEHEPLNSSLRCNLPYRSTGGWLDSMNVASQFAKAHPNLVAILPAGSGKGTVMPLIAEPASVLDSMLWLYQKSYEFPIPNWKSPNLGWATGYMMDTADYPLLLAQGSNVKTIGFHFGIRNYDDVLLYDSTPIFTMAIIPVDRNMNALPASKLTPLTGGGGGGYDFVQPCPGSPGCPTN